MTYPKVHFCCGGALACDTPDWDAIRRMECYTPDWDATRREESYDVNGQAERDATYVDFHGVAADVVDEYLLALTSQWDTKRDERGAGETTSGRTARATLPAPGVLQQWFGVCIVLCLIIGTASTADDAAASSVLGSPTLNVHVASEAVRSSTIQALDGPRIALPALHFQTPKTPMVLGLGILLTLMVVVGYLCLMMPGTSGQRLPPAWDPSRQSQYPFRQWTQDLLVWSIATDMDASRKAALVGMQLRGSAQELFRTIPPAALINGGFVNGAQVDPLTFLLHALSERFAALGDEVRLGAITDLLCFGRRSSHETVDDLLARFDILRQRAYDQGQLTMSITGLVWLLFRAVGVNDTQLIQLLQPFQGRVPQTEAELQALRVQLRRMGHVLEHAPGNIASSLRDNSARGQRAFLLNSEADANEGQGQDPWSEPDGYGWAGAAMPVDEQDNDSDAGTDTDTASSNGLPPPEPLPEGEEDITEQLFWAYQHAKSQWRRHMHKPTRAVRRFTRRFIRSKGKGKGQGKGFTGKGGKGRPNVGAFLAALEEHEVAQVFKGFRKGKGKRSSGKGKGRKENPIGKDGKRMRCFKCGSEQHLSRACPQRSSAPTHSGSQPSNFWVQQPDGIQPQAQSVYSEGPLAGLIFMAAPAPDEAPPSATESSWTYPSASSQGSQRPTDPWAEYLRQDGAFNFSPEHEPIPPRTRAHAGGPNTTVPNARTHVTCGGSNRTLPNPPAPAPTPSAATQSTQNAGGQSSMWNVASTPWQDAGRSASTAWLSEPPTLPAWAELPEMGFVTQPLLYRDPPHVPLFSGLPGSGDAGVSQVDATQAPLIEGIFQINEAVTRRWLGRPMPETPAIAHTSSLEASSSSAAFVDQFRSTQVAVQVRRKEARRLQKRTFDLPKLADNQTYEAVEGKCVLCQEEYQPRETVFRLACRHVFHASCWIEFLVHENGILCCPICRGSARIVARFSYVEGCEVAVSEGEASAHPSRTPSEEPQARAQTPGARSSQREDFDVSTPPRTSNPEAGDTPSPYQNFESFPWWTYSVLPKAEQCSAILVDPGAYTNLVGEDWVREMAEKCASHKRCPAQKRLVSPLHVQGVGHGSQKAEYSVTMPVSFACEQDGVETVAHHQFEAPVISQGGRHLPALLGLKSLREKAAILIMSPDDTELKLIVPGPAGVTIGLEPGSISYPLMTAPSGHLLLKCDCFGQTQARTNLRPESQVFPVVPDASIDPEAAFVHGLPVQDDAAASSSGVIRHRTPRKHTSKSPELH